MLFCFNLLHAFFLLFAPQKPKARTMGKNHSGKRLHWPIAEAAAAKLTSLPPSALSTSARSQGTSRRRRRSDFAIISRWFVKENRPLSPFNESVFLSMGGGGHYDYPKHVWSPAGGWMWERTPRFWKRNTGAFALSVNKDAPSLNLLPGIAVAVLGVCLIGTFNVSRSLEVRAFCYL